MELARGQVTADVVISEALMKECGLEMVTVGTLSLVDLMRISSLSLILIE